MARTKLTTKLASLPQIADLPGFEVIAEKLDRLVPDAYQPAQMVCRLEDACTAKTSRDTLSAALLGLFAGFFIGLVQSSAPWLLLISVWDSDWGSY